MCGIIGYVGYEHCQEVLFDGLKRLEYRGYDSAGLAWRGNGRTECVRAIGNLESLGSALAAHAAAADDSESAPVATATISAGIGHTRWATHGGVTERNAHPHADWSGRVRIVLNGIIENYLELRDLLAAEMIQCSSETDAEVVAQLISFYYDGDLSDAVRRAVAVLSGHFAFVAMCDDEPETLVGVRHECPLVVGIGDRELFIASSISAFIRHTRRVAVLHDGEIVVLRPAGVTVFDVDGFPQAPRESKVDWDEDRCEKDGFETFMLKEIHEQPTAIAETLRQTRVTLGPAENNPLGLDHLRDVRRMIIVGCGTSYHAGLAGRMAIERWARIPVEVDVASEFRYRNPLVKPNDLLIAITQSGETADTLAAQREARRIGAKVLSICNVVGSSSVREADAVFYTHSGPEIGVASTKAFTSQIIGLYLFAVALGSVKGTLTGSGAALLLQELLSIPDKVEQILARNEDIEKIARVLFRAEDFLYLGRGIEYPIALEGALKLKEISYIHAEGYPAGEMKHGPIALIDEALPVVFLAAKDALHEKIISNIQEVKSRGGRVLSLVTAGDGEIPALSDFSIGIPSSNAYLTTILLTVPLQLLAYHIGVLRGCDVDQPRNLAKSVTVE